MQKRMKKVKTVKFLKKHEESRSFKLKKMEEQSGGEITYRFTIKRKGT